MFAFKQNGVHLFAGDIFVIVVNNQPESCVVLGWIDNKIVLMIPREEDGVVSIVRGAHSNQEGFYEPDSVLPMFCEENADIDWKTIPIEARQTLSVLMDL